jgi:nitrogen fixation NifU-like protein
MGLLDELYQTAVLQHSRRPHNRFRPERYDVAYPGVNPGCGDELTLYLAVDGDRLATVAFEGMGCAISQASASLMTQAVEGKTAAEALALAADFKAMIRGEEPTERLGEARVLQGVSKLHARVKCATLPWVTLEQAVAELGPAEASEAGS